MSLTDKGMALRNKMLQATGVKRFPKLASLSNAELQQLMALLNKVVDYQGLGKH